MNFKGRRFFLLIVLVLVFTACSSDDNSEITGDGDVDSEIVDAEDDTDVDRELETNEREVDIEETDGDGDDDVEAMEDIEIEAENEGDTEIEIEEEQWIDPGYDAYHGSLGYQGEASGFFRVGKIGEQWWLFTPEGHPFFSTGINVVGSRGTGTADGVHHYEETVLAKYESKEAWADEQVRRLDEWGWNTIGAWSEWERFRDRVPYTVIVYVAGVNMTENGPIDFFADEFAAEVESTVSAAVAPQVDDPYLIGYYFGNEMHWGHDWRGKHLFIEYMAMPFEASPGKRLLVEYLQDEYETVEQLAVDFETEATNWEELSALSELSSRKTERSKSVRSGWTGIVSEKYFSLVDAAFRAADPNHLNLGVRFVSQLVPRPTIEAAGRYVDVMSINYYDLIGDLANVLQGWGDDYLSVADHLAEHYEAGGRPIMVTEWGFRAADSGLPNSYPPIYPTLDTQSDRADAYEEKFRALLSRNWFVGQHWFLYADQPPEGRFDGEDNNFGLITEADEPYPEMVERSAAMVSEIYRRLP